MDLVAILKFDWFRINMSGDLNWDAIFTGASVNVSEIFSKSVRRLLGG